MRTRPKSWDATDERLVRGFGAYAADVTPPGVLHAAFVRSWAAHGNITALDTAEARRSDDVVAVMTGADLAEHLDPIEVAGEGLALRRWTPIAVDRVRYVGEPVAVVIAHTPHAAEDAAQLVGQDIEELPVVTSPETSLEPETIRLHDDLDDNILYSLSRVVGDPDTAFRDADLVVERTFRCARQTPLPLETRGVVAVPTADGLEVTTSTQIPHIVRSVLAETLGPDAGPIRVIVPDVGGGFGLKLQVFGEEVIVSLVARLLGRPVKWIEDRRENLIASAHAHDQAIRVRVAARADGTLMGIDVDVTVDVGAHSVYPLTASLDVATAVSRMFSTYAVHHARLTGRAVGTNKAPVGAYRGVGFPAAVFATERMLDVVAAAVGRDRREVRFINLVQPDQMPYASATGGLLDPGDYPTALRTALAEAGVEEWFAQQQRAGGEGRLLGIGIVVFNELTGPGSAAYRRRGVTTIPGHDSAEVAVESDGRIAVRVSSAEAGQRHREAYRSLVLDELGVSPDEIDVIEGDTDATPPGSGTFASRAAPSHMTCVANATAQLKDQVCSTTASMLGCEQGDIDVKDGLVVDGRSGRAYSLGEISALARKNGLGPLRAAARWDPDPAYSYGAHACLVEVDPATLKAHIEAYVSVEDCGRIISPAGVEDQVFGGLVMGFGDALLEEHVYDRNGQPLTATMLDYLVPLATDLPAAVRSLHLETPTDRTPLGARGVGESGTVGGIATVGCAVADAVAQTGGELNSLPASPQRIFDALEPVLARLGTVRQAR